MIIWFHSPVDLDINITLCKNFDFFSMNFTKCTAVEGGGGVQTMGPAYKVDDETDDGYYYDNDIDDDKQMIYRQNHSAV